MLSWLTIFATCFGIFWFSLIVLLVVGLYRRDTRYMRYWLSFSSAGILIEMFLILYGFFSETKFQLSMAKNIILLLLGLIVESCFVYIIFQFYNVLCKCPYHPPTPCRRSSQRTPQRTPQRQSKGRRQKKSQHSSGGTRMLQSSTDQSDYRCGQGPLAYFTSGPVMDSDHIQVCPQAQGGRPSPKSPASGHYCN
ncbi:uncharacterized protein LOC115623146 isoform X2 [Scaptodrosophila lebanonensis]|uniref:Uncharacterized protein LOC115623146 isoform X2 n=1 Tax=Drosophila lebanonensis TaxID=7225 RepID=A0A6J2T8I4_DROLE|nr:uncharacterized protein LOC115623146 isoform X2 [Scaptodrosophila lebanonensis]